MKYNIKLELVICLLLIPLLIIFAKATIVTLEISSPDTNIWTNNNMPDMVFTAATDDSYTNSTTQSINSSIIGNHSHNIGAISSSIGYLSVMIVNDSAEQGTLNISLNGELIAQVSIPETSVFQENYSITLIPSTINNITYSVDTSGVVNITESVIVPRFSCELFIDDVGYGVNTTVTNNTATTITANESINDGVHTWYVNCTDADTNNMSEIRSITIDTANPTVTALNNPQNNSYFSSGIVEFNFSSFDNLDIVLNYTLYLLGLANETGLTVGNNTATNFTLTTVSEGVYDWTIGVRDNATNEANFSGTYYFTVDGSGPTVASLNYPLNNSYISGSSINFNFTSYDNIDTILNFTLIMNEALNETGLTLGNNTPTNITVGGFGNENTYNWSVEVKDDTGNAVNYSGHYYFTIDQINPNSTISTPENNTWSSDTTPEISFALTDNLDSVLNYTIYVDNIANNQVGSANNNTQTYLNLSELANGTHSIEVEARDEAWNRYNSTPLVINIDQAAPTVSSLNYPENNSYKSATIIDFNFTSYDNLDTVLNYTLILNSAANATGLTLGNNTATNFSVSGFVDENTYAWTIQVLDEAGNAANFSGIYYMTIDLIAPNATISTPANDTWTNDNTPEINFTLTDALDSVLNYTIYVDNSLNGQVGSANNNTPAYLNLSELANGTHTIEVEARDEAGNRYNSTPLIINVDDVSPSSIINTPSNNTWTTDSTPEISFTLTDALDSVLNYTIYVNNVASSQVGSADNGTQTYLNLSELANGTHTIEVEARDEVGNRYNSSGLTISIDDLSPVVSSLNAPQNNSNFTSGDIEFNFTSYDNLDNILNYTLYLDLAANTTGATLGNNSATNFTLYGLDDGIYIWTIQVMDEAGTKANYSGNYVFTIDSTAPVVSSLNSPGNNSYSDTVNIEFNFTSYDNLFAILDYSIYLDDEINETGLTLGNNTATNFTVYNIEEGPHNWTVQVADDLDNAANYSGLYYFFVDITAPGSAINNPSNDTWTSDSTPEINFTLTDALDSVLNYTIYVDSIANNQVGSANNNTPTYLNISVLNNATHSITVEARDEAGNRYNSTPLIINVDDVDPTSIINTPANNTWTTDSTPEISFTLTDALDSVLNYTIYVDNIANNQVGSADNGTQTYLNLSELANGTHTIEVEARDEADNRINSSTLIMTIDDVSPVVSALNAPDNNSNYSTNDITFNFTSYDNLDTTLNYTLYLDGFANETSLTLGNNTATNFSIYDMSDGIHIWNIGLRDDAGNGANYSGEYYFRIDTTPPTVLSLNSPSNNTYQSSLDVAFNFTSYDNLDTILDYALYLDGFANETGLTLGNNTATNFTVVLIEGNHYWTIEVRDDENNAVNYSGLSYLTVDSTNPNSTINTPNNNTWAADTTPEIGFTLADNLDTVLNYTIYVDNIANGQVGSADNNTEIFLNISSLTQGQHTVIVEARDEASNRYNSSGLVITIDTVTPNVSALNSPANNSNLSGSIVEFNFTSYDNLDTVLNYTLYLDNTQDAGGLTLGNNTATNFTRQGFAEGTSYNWTIEVADEAGNKANYSGTYYFNINSTNAPDVSINTPGNNTWTTDTSPEISFTATDDLSPVINYSIFIDSSLDKNGTADNNTQTYVNLSETAEGIHTIVVEATDNTSKTTNSSPLILNIDATAPTVYSLNSPLNETYYNNNNITFNFTSHDNLDTVLNYTLYLDGLANETGSTLGNNTATNFTIRNIVEGLHYWTIGVRDEINSEANYSGQYLFTIDTTAPNATISTPSNDTWTSDSTPEINFTLTDALDSVLNYTIYVNNIANGQVGSADNNTQTYLNLTSLTNGTRSIIVEARDEAGNRYNSTPLIINVDDVSPSSIINTPSNNTWTTDSTPEISFTLTDALDSVLNYTIYVNNIANGQVGSANNNTQTYLNLSDLTNGTHTIEVEARDEASNRYNSSGLVITIDTVAPNVSALNSPANNSNLSGSIVEFNFTSYDNLDNILNYTLYLDNYANSTGLTLGNNTTTNFSVNDFQEGTFHNWTIQVTDNVGNTANYSGMFFFYMNTTYSNQPPTSNIISPDNDGWISDSTPELSFILTDDLDIYINYTLFINDIANYSNSTANATPTYLNLSSLGEGSNTIIVEALDSSNERINSSILTLNIDTIPPSSTLHYPINDTWTNDDTIQFNFTLMDNLDSELDYTLYLDNSPVSYGSAQNNSIKLVNYTLPDEGFYLIKVEARDQANNTFNSTETLVVMDGNDPSSTISSPSDNSWITDATPEIIFILTDDFDPVLNYTVFVNNVSTEFGSALNNTPTSTNLTLSEGTFNIIIEARDNANARQNSTPITIFIDNNTPSSTINTPSNLTWISDITPEISFTLTDSMDSIINYSVFVDGSINSIGSANNNTPTYINLSTVTEAQHTLYVEARDEADQTFNSSVIIITTDVSAPAVSSLNSPANNTNISSSVIFNFTSYDNLDSILDYTLYLNSTINETGSTAGNDTTTSFTVSGFETFGAIYYWTIEVRDNASNAANYSGVHYFEVYDAPPNTAPNITEINDSDNDGNIEISWTADPNADYYRIYRSLSSITDATSLTALATTTALAYEDNTTIHDNTYWYAVTSLDSALNENKSVVSASYNATANDTILPRLPASFDATNLSDGSIALSWSQVLFDVNDNADTNITYRIYRGINITGLFNVSNLSYITSTALFNYTDTNITTDYNYTYAVTSLDDAGNENTSIDSTYQDITATPCVNGWSDWSDWGACSGGTQYRTRTRTCYGGGLTSEEESQSCDTGDDDGGRGGRSGGPGPSISLPSAIHEWTLLNPGAEISMKINNSQIGIINIFFSVSNQVNDGKLTVQRLSGKPAAVSHEISGKVYQYLKIDQENLENSVTSSFRIRFKVEKGWLEENGVNSNNLVLKKYSEEWNDLPTNKLNSDSDYVYYEAITSGFSYFAIAEKSQVTTSTEVAATSTTSTTTTLTETVTLSTTTTTTPKRAEFLHFLLGYISQKLNIIFITLALMLVTMISSYIFIVQKKRYDLEQEDFDMLKAHMETQDRLEKIREKLENIDKEK